jgi:hypothetical protein
MHHCHGPCARHTQMGTGWVMPTPMLAKGPAGIDTLQHSHTSCALSHVDAVPPKPSASPALQLRRLSLQGEYTEMSALPDFPHHLSTLTGLVALQVPKCPVLTFASIC